MDLLMFSVAALFGRQLISLKLVKLGLNIV